MTTSVPAGAPSRAPSAASTPSAAPTPSAASTPAGASTEGRGVRLEGLSKVLGGRVVVDGLDLDVAPGELVSLLGPSGCGKTTTLRMIAGFLAPDAGRVVMGGRDVTDLGAQHRPSAMVFQNYALWPHMSVLRNVGFPLRVRGVPRAEVRARALAALETVDLAHHASSRPAQVSGGEQQRAALARAIVAEPDVLLLDEPLSNLDARLRVRVREDIRELQQRLGITTVLVTHDQDEALAISDRVAVMAAGRIEQVSTPGDLYARPRTLAVAAFIGSATFLDASTLASATQAAAQPWGDAAQRCWAVRPEDVHFHPGAAPGEGDDAAEVVRVRQRGPFADVLLAVGPRRLSLHSLWSGGSDLVPGQSGRVRLGRVHAYVAGVLSDGPA